MSLHDEHDDIVRSGLMNLVEAATALTELVREVRVASTSENSSRELQAISDDEDQSPQTQGQYLFMSESLQNSADSASRSGDGPTLSTSTEATREIFPQRLMQILEDTSISDVITWLPHGKSFWILRPEAFTEKILPVYFPESRAASSTKSKETSSPSSYKYPSFTRKLNRWGFRQVTKGPDAGAFHHKFFKRCEPDLCLRMVCQKSRRPKVDDAASQRPELTVPLESHRVQSMPETARTVTDSESVTSGSRASQDESRKKRKVDPLDTHGIEQFLISVPSAVAKPSPLCVQPPTFAAAVTSTSVPSSATDGLKSVKTALPDACTGHATSEKSHDSKKSSKIIFNVLNEKSIVQGRSNTSQQLFMNCNVGVQQNVSYSLIPSATILPPSSLLLGNEKSPDFEAHVRAEKAKSQLYEAYIQALSL